MLKVAANVYLTVGANVAIDRPLFMSLVQHTQTSMRTHLLQATTAATTGSPLLPMLSSSSSSQGVLVHAYTDPVYNRSSLHLAGTPDVVQAVLVDLVIRAVARLSNKSTNNNKNISTNNNNNNNGETSNTTTTLTPHPTVGLVDHVSVMPLLWNNPTNDTRDKRDTSTSTSDSQASHTANDDSLGIQAAQSVARYVETSLRTHSILSSAQSSSGGGSGDGSGWDGVILPYGTLLDPYQSLATVRRTQTQFFQSIAPSKTARTTQTHPSDTSPSISSSSSSSSPSSPSGVSPSVILVGSTLDFVENYNIRFHPGNDDHARRLCRLLRARSGGLLHVEALTLPYGGYSYSHPPHGNDTTTRTADTTMRMTSEVACNLTRPSVSSVGDIDAVVHQYVASLGHHGNHILETKYRVGTTARQCHDALNVVSNHHPPNSSARRDYDSNVLDGLS